MEEIIELKKKFEEKRPAKWEMIPDIPLTKNQMVLYMSRQLVGTEGEDDITSAMINNYIKDGVMPRANGKTYSRQHIAYLTAISILKKSLAVKDIKTLIELSCDKKEVEDCYLELNEVLSKELANAAEDLHENMSKEDMIKLALELAVSAYAKRTLCEQIVSLMTPEEDKKEKTKKEDNKKEDKN